MVTSPSSLRPSIRLRTDFHHFAICKHVHSLSSTRSTRTILKKAPPYELNTHFFFVIIRAHRVARSANSVLRSKREYQKRWWWWWAGCCTLRRQLHGPRFHCRPPLQQIVFGSLSHRRGPRSRLFRCLFRCADERYFFFSRKSLTVCGNTETTLSFSL